MNEAGLRRIAIVGTSGAGKTTLAVELARRLDLAHIELDALYWLPDWQEPPRDEFHDRVDSMLLSTERWVCDGNYGAIATERADTIVWLDLPLRTCLWRTIRRTVRRARSQESLWGTNRERWTGLVDRKSLTWWVLTTFRRRRREYAARFADPRPGVRVLRLRSSREVEAWLGGLRP